LQPLSLEQGLKMRPVFLKIAEIQWDRLGPISEKLAQFIKKLALFTKKISTVHQRIDPKIGFGHLQSFPLRRIFDHWS
jgi:hypothetical protein